MEEYLKFQKHIRHPDLAYSLLYAWELDFAYCIRWMEGNPVIAGFDVSDELFFSVIPERPDSLIDSVRAARSLLSQLDVDIALKYVTAEYVDLFAAHGFPLTFDLDFSDYVYDAHEFIDLTGGKNKKKRHEYQSITKKYENHRYEDLSPENLSHFYRIFESWCASHPCDDCVWGCEKRAFERLMQLVRKDPELYCCGIAYLDDQPMSFGIAERINDDWVTYHMQKNAGLVSGLTYYLHYHMALKHLEIPYINWGEDMGIEGLRVNKRKYHPCCMEHKYEIHFQRSQP
ncbi:MAG: DUF2156 domain-containing protein [Clostridia bacterium]|nr:DUF2156 domain-containing protein [Clostridia bacterium]